MQLKLNDLGMIPANYPKVFFRVSTWNTGSFVADFTTEAEAIVASYASKNGTKYDHKVSTMKLVGA